ncbi:protein eyes shut, partial [Clarias magur]
INCSEILGQTNCMRQCRSGVCSQVSPNSFRCDCFSGYTGTFCTEKKDPCSSQPCGNRGKCEERGEEYICMCPEGFTSSNCEVKLEHNCTTLGCQQEQAYGIVRH